MPLRPNTKRFPPSPASLPLLPAIPSASAAPPSHSAAAAPASPGAGAPPSKCPAGSPSAPLPPGGMAAQQGARRGRGGEGRRRGAGSTGAGRAALLLAWAAAVLLLAGEGAEAQAQGTAGNPSTSGDNDNNAYDNCEAQGFSLRCLNDPLMNLPLQESYPATFFEQVAARAAGSAAPSPSPSSSPSPSPGLRRLLSTISSDSEFSEPPFERMSPDSDFSRFVEALHEPYIRMARRRDPATMSEGERERLLLRWSPQYRRSRRRRTQPSSSPPGSTGSTPGGGAAGSAATATAPTSAYASHGTDANASVKASANSAASATANITTAAAGGDGAAAGGGAAAAGAGGAAAASAAPSAISLQAPPLNSAPSEGFLSLSSPRYASVYSAPLADWRLPGLDTGVQNQGMCDSCWVVPSVDLIAIVFAATTGTPAVPLSAQHVCDCGLGRCCQGGWPEAAFLFGKQNGGIAPLASYPYTASNGICRAVADAQLLAPVKTWEMVPPGSTFALLQAVSNHPVLALVDFSSLDAVFYSGGIFTGSCSSSSVDHTVIVMGFNLNSAVPYIILKNSWGSSWGEGGYMRIAIVDDGVGLCGMLLEPPMYPVLLTNASAFDICASKPNPCGSGLCFTDNSTGAARCACKPGFVERLTSVSPKCVTSSPCSRNPNPCGVGRCSNQFDGQYTCSCPPGTVIGSKTDGSLSCVLATYQSGLPTYSIQPFDTCADIAMTFNITLSLFLYLNPFIDCSQPLPAGVTVLVASVGAPPSLQCQAMDQASPNDTCAAIAARNAISQEQLQALNPSLNCSSLMPGRQLCVLPGMLFASPSPLASCGALFTTTTGQRCANVAAALNISLLQLTAMNPQLKCSRHILITGTQVCSAPLTQQLLSVTCTAWYTVTNGDTCYRIYNAQQLSATLFMRLNPGLRCYDPFFQIGMQVCVNGTFTPIAAVSLPPNYIPYNVVPGDTLPSIARFFAPRCPSTNLLQDICSANTLSNCGMHSVTVGQLLFIPCSKSVGSSPCSPSLPVCGSTQLSFSSYCEANLNFGLPAVSSGNCGSIVALCAKHTFQKVPPNALNYNPDFCPFGQNPGWINDPRSDGFTGCARLGASAGFCINRACTVLCAASAATWTKALTPALPSAVTASGQGLGSVQKAAQWNATCMFNCVNVRSYNKFKWQFVNL